MKIIVPPKLHEGDEVRIIAPSLSLSYYMVKGVSRNSEHNLRNMGLTLSYGKNARKIDCFQSSSVKDRVEDFYEAIKNPRVKLVLAAIGGYNSNQLLESLDYTLIEKNPKIIMSHSDGVALLVAIYTKTGLITYSGPTYFAFGEKNEFFYTRQYVEKTLFNNEPFTVSAAKLWTSDKTWPNESRRKFVLNEGFWVIQPGRAEGTILGDNFCTFQLLQGTKFWPTLKNTILFLEDDGFSGRHILEEFDRNLVSLTQQRDFHLVKGLVIGRFNGRSGITREVLTSVIKNKIRLKGVPVIANVDFGHTSPRITLPIGGTVSIAATDAAEIKIIKH